MGGGGQCVPTHAQELLAGAECSVVCQVEPGSEHLLLGSCGDGGFATWDIRKLGRKMKAVASASHSRTCSSAYFDPTGEHQALHSGLASIRLLNEHLLPGCERLAQCT